MGYYCAYHKQSCLAKEMKMTIMYKRHIKIALIGLLIGALAGCADFPKPQISIPASQPKAIALHKPIRVALVLGGGGARGLAHLGVLQVLEENHIPIDLIVGTSAGSIIGAMYADKPEARPLTKLMINTPRNQLLDFSIVSPATGLVSGNALQDFLLSHMHAKTFRQLKIPFVAVATDFKTGSAYRLQSGPIAPAVNASSAIPGIFRPVHIYHRVLVDGGISQPVPVPVAQSFHPQIIIAVNIDTYLPKKIPSGIFRRLGRSYIILASHLTSAQTQGANIVLHPDVAQISAFDDTHQRRLVKAGRLVALKALPIIKKMLALHHIKS